MIGADNMGLMGWGMIMEERGWRKGPWTSEEDRLLIEYVRVHGEGRWNSVARLAGLRRNGKSCRLRWVNYLRPDLKRGQITPHEETIILDLHARWGNRWSTIARSLPGRTDNEIKNYWRTHFKKKTKVSTLDQAEKSKSRLLRKQQFHHQQQQYQQQQPQQQQQQQQPPSSQPMLQYDQQQQFSEMDMKKIVYLLLDEGENDTNPTLANYGIANEEEGFYPMVNHNDISSTSEGSNNNDEELLWNNFWRMDDDFGQGSNNWSSMCVTSKVGIHHAVTPFC